jgi:hypothetical protein
MRILLPPLYAINFNINGNSIRQVLRPMQWIEGTSAAYSADRAKGRIITPAIEGKEGEILLLHNKGSFPQWFKRVLVGPTDESKARQAKGESLDLSQSTWLRNPSISSSADTSTNYRTQAEEVFNSWRGAFSFIEEDPNHDLPPISRTPV